MKSLIVGFLKGNLLLGVSSQENSYWDAPKGTSLIGSYLEVISYCNAPKGKLLFASGRTILDWEILLEAA